MIYQISSEVRIRTMTWPFDYWPDSRSNVNTITCDSRDTHSDSHGIAMISYSSTYARTMRGSAKKELPGRVVRDRSYRLPRQDPLTNTNHPIRGLPERRRDFGGRKHGEIRLRHSFNLSSSLSLRRKREN